MNARDAGGADGGRRRVEAVSHRSPDPTDLMNDLMSLGAHRLWRREAVVAALRLRPGRAGARSRGRGRETSPFGCAGGRVSRRCATPTRRLLREGRRRGAASASRGARLEFAPTRRRCRSPTRRSTPPSWASASATCRGSTTRWRRAARVLKPCGRFVCLEFSPGGRPPRSRRSTGPGLRHAIPTLGAAVAGDRGAYEYLAESIRRFPPPEVFVCGARPRGFAGARSRSLWGGIVRLHCGWRV